MDTAIAIFINGQLQVVQAGTSVAAALMACEHLHTRDSVSGETRFAVCGMGVCQECRVSIDGVAHRLACQSWVSPGMRIETGGRVSRPDRVGVGPAVPGLQPFGSADPLAEDAP